MNERGDAEEFDPEAFRQSDAIRDYVFPLCVAVGSPGKGWEVRRFLVHPQRGSCVMGYSCVHEREDVALVKLTGGSLALLPPS